MRATSRLVGLGFASAALLLAQDAAALPPPMTEQELMDASDLVIDGVGMFIECEGPPVADGNMISTFYVTQIFPSQTYKGTDMRSIHVRGQQVDWIVPVAGPWFPDPIPVGWSGRLYLVQNNDGTYSEVWWNGTEEDQTSAPDPLPDCGAAGAGGTGGFGGSGAEGGTAGTGGGTDTGGTAGDVTGGTAGDVTGGTAGDVTGGTAGDVTGGTAGDVTGGTAGDVTGGTGADMTGGTGADMTGGSGGDLSGGSGGSSTGGSETGGEAGTDGEGTGGGTGPGDDSGDDGGCGCRAAGKSTPNLGLTLMLGAALCAARLRRTRRAPRGVK